jgi:predicted amidohydrolase
MKFIRAFIIFPLLIYGIYTFWSRADRYENAFRLDLNLQEFKEFGKKQGKGNVVGIQPYMLPEDYASEVNFWAKLDGYLYEAQKHNYLDTNTLVIFPEYIGTWLVAMNERKEVYQASKLDDAMFWLLAANLGDFWQVSPPKNVDNAINYSLFAMKSTQMAQVYQRVFGALAKKYQVHIVAGSILLCNPYIAEDTLYTTPSGELFNTSLVFKPNGKVFNQIIKKVYPIAEEKGFVQACPVAEIPTFDLPIGKTGVLICADSWFAAAYDILKKQGVTFIAVPSYIAHNQALSQPWQGYSGFDTPAEAQADIQKITEGEAWLKYALAGKFRLTNAKNAMNVFLRGKLWDIGSDGGTILVQEGQVQTLKNQEGASIVCQWL